MNVLFTTERLTIGKFMSEDLEPYETFTKPT